MLIIKINENGKRTKKIEEYKLRLDYSNIQDNNLGEEEEVDYNY